MESFKVIIERQLLIELRFRGWSTRGSTFQPLRHHELSVCGNEAICTTNTSHPLALCAQRTRSHTTHIGSTHPADRKSRLFAYPHSWIKTTHTLVTQRIAPTQLSPTISAHKRLRKASKTTTTTPSRRGRIGVLPFVFSDT